MSWTTPATITRSAEQMLERIAEQLEIPSSSYEAAERSYQSVGRWLNRPESVVASYNPTIYAHGSFRLGTVVRPPTEEDYFDLDVVCEVARDKGTTTQKEVKEAIGDELKRYAERFSMQRIETGQYCWTLHYADTAQFQMDVLPAVPDSYDQRQRLRAESLSELWAETAIGITNSKHPQYATVSRNWPASNPRGYADWFRSRMQIAFQARRRAIALAEGKADVEAIPEYRVKTPLQRVVQLLKRHRDGAFADRPDVRPASIILSTLAAHAYGQEETLTGALFSVLGRFESAIESRLDQTWIGNPSDPRENFADAWKGNPAPKAAFYEWLQMARSDFHNAATSEKADDLVEILGLRMGRELLERATRAQAGSLSIPTRTGALRRLMSAPHKQPLSWPVLKLGTVTIKNAIAARPGFRPARFGSNGPALAKHCDLRFEAETTVKWPYEVYWQVVNTGKEAQAANGLRGAFYAADVTQGALTRKETTLYSGTHSIECFVVKGGNCVAQSGPFIVNIV